MKSPDEYVKAVVGGLAAAGGAYVAAYQAHAGVPSEIVLTAVAFAVAFGGVYSVKAVKGAVAAIVAAGAAFTGAYGHSPLPLVITMTVAAGLAGFSAVRWTDNTPPATKP